jgi:DNA-binding MarR family transcriptional regulator
MKATRTPTAPTAPTAPAAPAAEGDTQRMLRRWRDEAPQDRLAHLVKDAMRAFDRALHARLALHAVAPGHWPFLRILWKTDGLTQRELSREAGVMEPTTFAAIRAMELLGYVVRRQQADNRRKNHVFLTRKGRSLERVLVPLAEEVNRLAARGIAPAAVATTRTTLLAVLENLARDEAGAAGGRRRVASTREIGRRVDDAARRNGGR